MVDADGVVFARGDVIRTAGDIELLVPHLDHRESRTVRVRPPGTQDFETEQLIEVQGPVQVPDPETNMIKSLHSHQDLPSAMTLKFASARRPNPGTPRRSSRTRRGIPRKRRRCPGRSASLSLR